MRIEKDQKATEKIEALAQALLEYRVQKIIDRYVQFFRGGYCQCHRQENRRPPGQVAELAGSVGDDILSRWLFSWH